MATYNVYGIVKNNTDQTLNFWRVQKATDDDPCSGDSGELYHGEMTDDPGNIGPGEETTFSAKSTGSTIQGVVKFKMVTDNDYHFGCYFHLKDGGVTAKTCGSALNNGYKGSKDVTDSGYHPTITYTIKNDD